MKVTQLRILVERINCWKSCEGVRNRQQNHYHFQKMSGCIQMYGLKNGKRKKPQNFGEMRNFSLH